MAKGKRHSDEIRAQVIAALLTGQGVAQVAREYSLDQSVVSRWKRSLTDGELQGIASEKRERLGDLLEQYVRRALDTLRVQAEHFADKAWLQRQPASEAAVLHGVLADKTIRILEAIEPEPEFASESESEELRIN